MIENAANSVSDLLWTDFLAVEAIDELNKIEDIEQEIDRDDLIYETDNKQKG